MRRFVLCILVTLISLIGADRSARGQKAAPKITVSYTSFNMPAAIVWIAKEERLFAKYGLNEELIFIPGGPTAMSALASGSIDFAQLRSIDGKPGRATREVAARSGPKSPS